MPETSASPVRPRTIVPTVLAVDVAAAAAPAGHVTYHGGALITAVKVQAIFWGAAWQQAPQSGYIGYLDNFFTFVVQSSLIDALSEYSAIGQTISRGRYLGSRTSLTPLPGGTLSDADIQTTLQNWVSTGFVAPPDANTLYFVFLPPNVISTFDGQQSCAIPGYCGYHNHVNGQIYYAVQPFLTCNGCSYGTGAEDSFTKVASHELCEAITNPAGGGWWDDNTGEEIGDICNKNFVTLGPYLVQGEWSNARSTCTVAAWTGPLPSANYQGFSLETGTALAQGEDGNGDFLMADYDQDGVPDLVFIKQRNTGTGRIEVHILSGASQFQNFIVQTGTPLAQGEDANGDFFMADYDADGIPDLIFVKRRNTGTGRIEVHVLSGASRFQNFILQTGTPLAQAEDGNGSFSMATGEWSVHPVTGRIRADLCFIKRRNTGTNHIEVHVLQGTSNYQQFTVETGTALAQGEDGNGDFLMISNLYNFADLAFIKRRNTGSRSIEVHILSSASNFQQFVLESGSGLWQAEDGNGDFSLPGYDRSLYFIKRRNTGTNHIEVHVLPK